MKTSNAEGKEKVEGKVWGAVVVQAWYSGKPSCVGRFPRDYVIGRNCQAHKADASTGEAEIHMLQRCTKGNKAQASGLVKMSQ